jgi:hypothetical protein
MSEDYTDFYKWVEQKSNGDEVYLSENEDYSLENVISICTGLLEGAKAEGLVGCFLRFSSNMTSYDSYLDSPSVVAVGYRPWNESEKNHERKTDLINKLAIKKGITYYEATHLKNFMDKGVV